MGKPQFGSGRALQRIGKSAVMQERQVCEDIIFYVHQGQEHPIAKGSDHSLGLYPELVGMDEHKWLQDQIWGGCLLWYRQREITENTLTGTRDDGHHDKKKG